MIKAFAALELQFLRDLADAALALDVGEDRGLVGVGLGFIQAFSNARAWPTSSSSTAAKFSWNRKFANCS